MSISSLSVRAVCVTYNRPRSSNEIPIGSTTMPSGAQRLSWKPGATWADIDDRPACESLTAESGVSRTVVGVKVGIGSTTNARTGPEGCAAVEEDVGAGTGTDWQA